LLALCGEVIGADRIAEREVRKVKGQ